MLKVEAVSFGYSSAKRTLQNIDFSLHKGNVLCVMGESGCGKSTLLKVIYGLLDLDHGTIFWDDIEVLGPAHHLVPGMPFIKHVAQDFDLMPFTSVSENIKKFLSRFDPEKSEERTQELLKVIEMTEFANAKVKTLSGGQQQRVAIARALAKEPALILLDEPFSQIDNFKKNSLRRNLFSYLKEKNIACIIATHDGDDALSFADDILVLHKQKILAKGTPKEMYGNPKNKYIAALFDDVNELLVNNKNVLLYPHQLKIVEKSAIEASVINSYYKGSHWLIEVQYRDQPLFVKHAVGLQLGLKVFLKTDKID
ncbi:ABC transporter ATP-binding protein [Polaribacter pacificus]|uniref:ABC transporter ATP-binding protein n=1 Tax=Polaribacter pacificus TaxID=1775173 RepID=A0A917MEG2_9FLAO|nr:ABC transporter ATP-binding protein [Polaribacter pacificus]GGG93095.1 ABC transporter ATP-binding protein [Polaribacter pacificus]